MKFSILVFSCWMLLATVLNANDATLKLRFVWEDDPVPLPQPFASGAAGASPGVTIINESPLVDPESKGIQNVVVWVDASKSGLNLDLPPYRGEKRRLTMLNARFEPHILTARAGDTLEMIDQGPEGHSPNIAFINNPLPGFFFLPGRSNFVHLAKSETEPIPISCNVHPWMKAYLLILDHPFAAVSDGKGAISIEGLPVNTDLTFRVYHETGTIDQVKVNDVPAAWNRSRFKLKLSPGLNDLGDIRVAGDFPRSPTRDSE